MRFHPRVTPWRIDDAEFYELERREGQFAFLLRYAMLAPSVRNTQPWAFHITSESVEVYADYTRRLTALDREDRELLISLGAAITNLRVAAAHFGFDTQVTRTRDSDPSVPVAIVRFLETCDADPHLAHLFPAIKKRRTNRNLFDHEPLDPHDVTTLFDFMSAWPDSMRIVLPCDLPRAAELVEIAERLQFAHADSRDEIDEWLHEDNDHVVDGICADGLAVNRLARYFATPKKRARRDRALVASASALIVIASDDDQPSLVEAGEILERLLLLITRLGLQSSIITSPIEVDHLRDRVWMLAAAPHPPQVIVRIGRGRHVTRAMPRRRLESVLR